MWWENYLHFGQNEFEFMNENSGRPLWAPKQRSAPRVAPATPMRSHITHGTREAT
jgi:hypothetical protein